MDLFQAAYHLFYQKLQMRYLTIKAMSIFINSTVIFKLIDDYILTGEL